jgi:hypothetical protein
VSSESRKREASENNMDSTHKKREKRSLCYEKSDFCSVSSGHKRPLRNQQACGRRESERFTCTFWDMQSDDTAQIQTLSFHTCRKEKSLREKKKMRESEREKKTK